MNNAFVETYYTAEKTKIKVSTFVLNILNNDAQAFGFVKSDSNSNINGLLNKLIPTLVEVKKMEQGRLFEAAQQFNFTDAKKFCAFAEIAFDDIYFYDAELEELEEYIWIRPNEKTRALFNDIVKVELPKAAVELSVYIRKLLNKYARFPQYKREALVFDEELEAFVEARDTGHIFRFIYNDQQKEVFAYNYIYGYLHDQSNYLICYDFNNKLIRSYPLCDISKPKVTRKPFRPSEKLIDCLAAYEEGCDLQAVIEFEEEQ